MLWYVALLCFLAVNFVMLRYYTKIFTLGNTIRAKSKTIFVLEHISRTGAIVLLPVVICSLSLATLFVPRQASTWQVIKAAYEGYCFYSFYRLLVYYVGGGEKLVSSLQGSRLQVWAPTSSPCRFFILFYKLTNTSHNNVNVNTFWRVEFLVTQFVVAAPTLAVTKIVIEDEFVHKLEMTSMVACMYGLFILMYLTHDALHHLQGHGKFWTMKIGLLGVGIMYNAVQEHTTQSYPNYSTHIMGSAYAATIASVLMVPLSFAIKYYFPIDELKRDSSCAQHCNGDGDDWDDMRGCDLISIIATPTSLDSPPRQLITSRV